MPEFILPAEADRCPHCDKVLRDPPNCCPAAQAAYRKEWNERLLAADNAALRQQVKKLQDNATISDGRLPWVD